jgi:hypothetical protein
MSRDGQPCIYVMMGTMMRPEEGIPTLRATLEDLADERLQVIVATRPHESGQVLVPTSQLLSRPVAQPARQAGRANAMAAALAGIRPLHSRKPRAQYMRKSRAS